MKTCKGCGETKPEERFSRIWRDKPQRQRLCKDCARAERYRWAIENPDKVREYRRRDALRGVPRKSRDPAQVKRSRERDYVLNAERYKQRSREWRRENPDRLKKQVKDWIEANPEGAAAMRSRARHKRRARMLNAFVEDVEPLIVLESTDGACGICGEDVDPFDFELDHVLPLACGGMHAYYNVQPAHALCNRSKGGSL